MQGSLAGKKDKDIQGTLLQEREKKAKKFCHYDEKRPSIQEGCSAKRRKTSWNRHRFFLFMPVMEWLSCKRTL
ncbi:hypothetical protein DESPIGER_2170 [Desulfovibrio piger]|uniref:Uncharacterized protein n=1 Tax=Desulfovibrio piger TaxID=901 RepID=A0A1K1LH20_9BACT|nr:hypothetical protein DESPIGER_2170 [Desulfovibrio piger]